MFKINMIKNVIEEDKTVDIKTLAMVDHVKRFIVSKKASEEDLIEEIISMFPEYKKKEIENAVKWLPIITGW